MCFLAVHNLFGLLINIVRENDIVIFLENVHYFLTHLYYVYCHRFAWKSCIGETVL